MAFRAEELAKDYYERVRDRLIYTPNNGFTEEQTQKSEDYLKSLMFNFLGPAVQRHPCWHPLLSHIRRKKSDTVFCCARITDRFPCLDHTWIFAHGFITCPYDENAPEEIQAFINKYPKNDFGTVRLLKPSVPFYHIHATPVVVYFCWNYDFLTEDKLIKEEVAVALMVKRLMAYWLYNARARSWDEASGALLGEPCGKLSSLFVNRETGMAMKRCYEELLRAGVLGEYKSPVPLRRRKLGF